MKTQKIVKILTNPLPDCYHQVKAMQWARTPKSVKKQIIKIAQEEKLPKYHINRETNRLETIA